MKHTFKQNIIDLAREVQKIGPNTKSTDIVNPELKAAFDMAIKSDTKFFGNPENVKNFQTGIINGYISNQAIRQDGKAKWSGSINPFFLGIHRDAILQEWHRTNVSEANFRESVVTKKTVGLDRL